MGDNQYSSKGFRRYSYWIYCPKSHWLVYLSQHAQIVGSAYPLYQPVVKLYRVAFRSIRETYIVKSELHILVGLFHKPPLVQMK
jgi:hypothetical protein